MNILVTGGAGFIGSNLSLELEKSGHSVTVADNLMTGSRKNLAGFGGRFVKCDVSRKSFNAKFKKKKFDIIFHEAAITDTTYRNDKEMLRANVEGFKNVLKLADGCGCPVVYASSAATYGRGKSPMREGQKPAPLNAYAVSKKLMDDITKARIKKGGPAVIGLRYFNVYGPREGFKGSASSMIYQLYLQMKAGRNPRIFKYGEQKRDFVYVKDIVSANLLAMKKALKGVSGIFNAGTGCSESFNKIVSELNRNTGLGMKAEYFDNPYPFYQNVTEADPALSRKTLGYSAKYDLKKGIRDYAKYLKGGAKK